MKCFPDFLFFIAVIYRLGGRRVRNRSPFRSGKNIEIENRSSVFDLAPLAAGTRRPHARIVYLRRASPKTCGTMLICGCTTALGGLRHDECETSPPTTSAFGRGRRHAPSRLALRLGASLS